MSKDFANRKSRTTSRRTPARGTPSRSTSRAKRPNPTASRATATGSRKHRQTRSRRSQSPVFHGPSFSGGVVLGALLVLAGAFLPEIFSERVEQSLAVKSAEPQQPVQFEFAERLRSSEVRADPDAYADDVNPGTSAVMEYLIQAASFQTMDDAESLRAQLILIDLPVRTNAVRVGDKPWYRVTVGPFISQVEAGRAMTRLRELNLDAFLIKRERPRG